MSERQTAAETVRETLSDRSLPALVPVFNYGKTSIELPGGNSVGPGDAVVYALPPSWETAETVEFRASGSSQVLDSLVLRKD